MCSTGHPYMGSTGHITGDITYYHHQIGSIHLSHCCHIFPWLCVWDGCTIIFCHLLHMYPGNTGTWFPLLIFSLWYLQMIGYIIACRSCLFVCRLHRLIIIIMQNYLKGIEWLKRLTVVCCRVCLRLRQFSQLSFIQYMGLCIFSLPNSDVMILRMCTLSYYHHQIGSMNHQPLFRVRSWNNGMCCMSYMFLCRWVSARTWRKTKLHC